MIATRLAETVEPFVGGELPVRLRAWDGSEAGPVDAPLVELRSPDAVRRLLRHPGELGAAQAYVTGELEVHHDLDEALTYVFAVARERGLGGRRPSPGRAGPGRPAPWPRWVCSAGRPTPPATQARIRGRLHSTLRDRSSIAHHYDFSNDFYALLLDRVDGLLVRVLHQRRPVVHRRRRPARQARPGLPQARPDDSGA